MLSCKDITENANQYLDRELPFFTRLKVKIHLRMCQHCDRYVKQLQTTIRALGKMNRQEPVDDATVDSVLKHIKEYTQSGSRPD